MKKLTLIALTTSLLFLANQALANSKNFEGAAALIGLEKASYNSKLTSSDDTGFGNQDYGRSQIFAVTNLQYLQAVNDKWLLGGGVSYDLQKQTVGQNHSYVNSVDRNARVTAKNHYSIYLQPTYATSNQTALFAKLGYHSTRATFSDQNGQILSGFGNSRTKDLQGVGYGFGFMHFLNSNVFAKGEIEFVNYKAASLNYGTSGHANLKLSSTAGIMSLGYKF